MMRFAFAFALLTWPTMDVTAQVVLQPDDLQAGDQYRLIFTTYERIHAESTDIDFYNEAIQRVADNSPVGELGATWKAVVSTEEIDARDNTDTNRADGNGVPIYRLDGIRVFNDYRSMWADEFGRFGDNPLGLTNLNVTQFDQTLPITNFNSGLVQVWTGTNLDGSGFDARELGTARPVLGGANIRSNLERITAGFAGNSSLLHMYALSEVITVVPEPRSGTMMLFMIMIAFWGRNRRLQH